MIKGGRGGAHRRGTKEGRTGRVAQRRWGLPRRGATLCSPSASMKERGGTQDGHTWRHTEGGDFQGGGRHLAHRLPRYCSAGSCRWAVAACRGPWHTGWPAGRGEGEGCRWAVAACRDPRMPEVNVGKVGSGALNLEESPFGGPKTSGDSQVGRPASRLGSEHGPQLLVVHPLMDQVSVTPPPP